MSKNKKPEMVNVRIVQENESIGRKYKKGKVYPVNRDVADIYVEKGYAVLTDKKADTKDSDSE